MKTITAFNPNTDPAFPALQVSYTGTAGSTAPYGRGPQAVNVLCSTIAYVLVGESVTATTSNGMPVPANQLVTIAVPPGTGAPWQVSAVQDSTGGSLYVKPVSLE